MIRPKFYFLPLSLERISRDLLSLSFSFTNSVLDIIKPQQQQKDLILTLKDPSFDQSEVDLDLEARMSPTKTKLC